MKVVPKGSVCKFGNKTHVSNICVGNIVTFHGRLTYGINMENKIKLLENYDKGKVIQINCDKYWNMIVGDGAPTKPCQYDLLIELTNGLGYYVPSMSCKKMVNPQTKWNNFLSR